MTNGIRDFAALAADDAAVEEEIERTGGNGLRLGLYAYAFHAEEALKPADWDEEAQNRLALVRPALPWYLLPIAVLSIAVILAVVL